MKQIYFADFLETACSQCNAMDRSKCGCIETLEEELEAWERLAIEALLNFEEGLEK